MVYNLYTGFSRKFYEHTDKFIKHFIIKNEFLNSRQFILQKRLYHAHENANYNGFSGHYPIILIQQNKNNNERTKYNKIKTIAFANIFGASVVSQRDENLENEDIKIKINEFSFINKSKNTNSKDANNLDKSSAVIPENDKNKSKDDKYEYYQELSEYSNMQIFSSNSHHELANEICSNLGISLGRAYIGKYSDGEITLQIMDEVRGRDVYIIHSTPAGGKDVHSRLMELFLFVSTLRRSSAKKVIVVLPYLNYSRQNKQTGYFNNMHSLGAPEIAILLQTCGADSIIAVDLNNPRIEGFSTDQKFFQPPLMNINPQSLAVEYLKKKKLHNPVIVPIDIDGAEKAKEFWVRMKKHSNDVGFTTLVSSTCNGMNSRGEAPSNESKDSSKMLTNKQKNGSSQDKNNINLLENEKITIVGDIKDCDCIIVNDILDTGKTSKKVAALLKNAGARKIYLYATHAILSDGCISQINDSCIDEVVTTNTIHIPRDVCCEKMHILSVAKLVAEGIKRFNNEQSQNAREDFSDGQVELNV
ncbi:ribose-phosphate pyrophosphokinase [Plasmodium vinckei petteri]|uniref:ribose-phosphate diphosphokinase n=1 Tax=Plasmodium vinckei petteri TaxID=138298 RepID=W7AE40_PLAVN|nr:ribose-phosphate pyrophosphokinase [Plasmodium vinckei petteri]CAD2098916.1 ribose-phosphate pyrophosphokinase, putative [Plasmodium vinckei petteri]